MKNCKSLLNCKKKWVHKKTFTFFKALPKLPRKLKRFIICSHYWRAVTFCNKKVGCNWKKKVEKHWNRWCNENTLNKFIQCRVEQLGARCQPGYERCPLICRNTPATTKIWANRSLDFRATRSVRNNDSRPDEGGWNSKHLLTDRVGCRFSVENETTCWIQQDFHWKDFRFHTKPTRPCFNK